MDGTERRRLTRLLVKAHGGQRFAVGSGPAALEMLRLVVTTRGGHGLYRHGTLYWSPTATVPGHETLTDRDLA